ncbi:MAG: hypothetical protein ABL961_15585 [Vicinamibacterales bacterium]
MLTFPVIGVAIALVLAVVALLRARSAVRRLERITESYWELRYETGQLKSRVSRLELTTGLREIEPDAEAPRPAAPTTTTFISLASLKK